MACDDGIHVVLCFCLHAVRRAREREGERDHHTHKQRDLLSLHKACLNTPLHPYVFVMTSFMFFSKLNVRTYVMQTIVCVLTVHSPVYLCVCHVLTISCNPLFRVLFMYYI